MSKSVKVETQYGPLEVTVIRADYVSVHHHDDAPFVVRGKEYSISLGVRVPGYYVDENRQGISKRGDFSAFPVVAPTIKAAILKACTDAALEYCLAHPDVMWEAERESVSNDVKRLQGQMDVAQRTLDELKAKHAERVEYLASLPTTTTDA